MGLTITLKENNSIVINGDITIKMSVTQLRKRKPGKVSLTVDAPKGTTVRREDRDEEAAEK